MISVRYFQPGPFSPLPLSAWTQVCQRFEAKNLAEANSLLPKPIAQKPAAMADENKTKKTNKKENKDFRKSKNVSYVTIFFGNTVLHSTTSFVACFCTFYYNFYHTVAAENGEVVYKKYLFYACVAR